MKCNYMAQDRDQWWTGVNTAMNRQVQYIKRAGFLCYSQDEQLLGINYFRDGFMYGSLH